LGEEARTMGVNVLLNCLPFLGHKKWEVRLYV